ncbi:hemolysin family protein [Pseudonocardia xishanensis]|uniref:Hemolysin family protein n=1 Tax=Pseudonocardia xishanensis TaxID=630995 RepID=A0ABP8S4J8_9PSEU
MNAAGLLVVAIILIPVAGIFAAADAAFTSVSSARVADLVRAGRPGSRALAKIVEDRARYLNLLILLRLMGETVATVLLTIALATWITPAWAGVLTAAAVMVVVSYVLIGVGPRTLGRQHPYALGMAVAAPIRVIATLLGPITKLLILFGNAITPGRGFREGPFSSEVELRELVDMASTTGVVDEGERKMIHSVFELGDTIVRDVMQPRPDVVWAERDTPVQKVVRLALKSGYSRIPVLGEDIDDIVGVAYLKDLVGTAWERPEAALVDVVRPPVFVPDSKRIDELLSDMQRTRNHMAIVVDEYGGTAGLVTIEDILEEIVGDISDEYDTAEVPEVQRLDGGTLRLAARLPVEDLQELFAGEFTGTERAEQLREVIEEADVDTIGGLLAQRLGKVPLPGAECDLEGLLHLRGEGGKDARGRVRITSVLVTPLSAPESENDYEAERETVSAAREESDVRQ